MKLQITHLRSALVKNCIRFQASLQLFCLDAKRRLSDVTGVDEWVVLALKILLAFLIFGIIVAILIVIFKDQVGQWFDNTIKSFFPAGGENRPTT